MELKDKIIQSVIEEFNKNGIKFTMDDLAKEIGVSKRTIYEQVGNKEQVISILIDEAFFSIKKQEKEILCNEELDSIDKIKKIIGIMPSLGGVIEYRRMFELKNNYPKLYEKIENSLVEGWEKTLALINKDIKEGRIKPINVDVLKEVLLATMESMLTGKFLIKKNLSYQEGLREMIEIIFNGIVVQ